MRLVEGLMQQVDGKIEITYEPGVRYEITLPADEAGRSVQQPA
jgi:two-component sensor histidine kinase